MSLDPRINRLSLPAGPEGEPIREGEQWEPYEVFHQKKRGDHPAHVGSVHAPSPELALVFAKEQFGRRQRCTNLWVARSSDIYTFRTGDEDMFFSATSEDKKYRDAGGFQVRDRINKFKKEHNIQVQVKKPGYFGDIEYS